MASQTKWDTILARSERACKMPKNWYHLENSQDEPGESSGWWDEASQRTATGLSNRWLAILLFIAIEALLFLFLIVALIYLRMGGAPWPPAGVSRQALLLPALNLVVLLSSTVGVYSAERCIRRYRITTAEKRLLLASGLGLIFLAIQVREYTLLFLNGITLASSLYGALFYLTIGVHGLHVLSGIIWLSVVWYLTRDARQTPDHHLGVQAAVVYWGFVTAVWIFLFLLLYVL